MPESKWIETTRLRFCFAITATRQKIILSHQVKPSFNQRIPSTQLIFLSVFVGTDISDDIQLITNNKGSTVLFYNGFKYLKSGESKTSLQYRCVNYMKKCRSRIIFNRENETAMKNEIYHNHENDRFLYKNFEATADVIRRFGKNKNVRKLKQVKRLNEDTEK